MKTAAAIILGLIPIILGIEKYRLALLKTKGYKKLLQDLFTAHTRAKSTYCDLAELFAETDFIIFFDNGRQINEGEFEKYGLNKEDILVFSALINLIEKGDTAAVNSGFEAAAKQFSASEKSAQEYLKTTAAMYLKVSLALSAAVFLIII